MCKFGTLSVPKLGEEHCPYTHEDGKYHCKIIVCQHPEVIKFLNTDFNNLVQLELELEVLMPIVPELVHGASLLQLPHGTVVAQRAHPRPVHRGRADVIGGDIVVDPAVKKH